MPKTSRKRADPAADFGPRARLDNGTAVMSYRADPAAPHAPAIRAARAFVRYEHMGLAPAEFDAAKRISEAAEICSGAKEREGNSLRSAAFWDRGGPTVAALEAARHLRDLREVLGWHAAYCVVRVVVDGHPAHEAEARDGLKVMARWWKL
jgi:hypothetical protein